MSKLGCLVGYHKWSMTFDGKKTTLGDHHQIRICMDCRKKQWRFTTDVDWKDGEEPAVMVQPTTDPFNILSGGVPPRPNKPPPPMGPLSGGTTIQQAISGVAQGFEVPEKRVVVIKASSRRVWLDAEGNVIRESDEEEPNAVGLTDAEKGLPG